jgi:hypothetical protein
MQQYRSSLCCRRVAMVISLYDGPASCIYTAALPCIEARAGTRAWVTYAVSNPRWCLPLNQAKQLSFLSFKVSNTSH